MFQQTQFLDIVFLVIIALFLFLRLKSVLGTRPTRKDDLKDKVADVLKIVDISEYRTLDNMPQNEETPDIKDDLSVVKESADGVVDVLEKIRQIDPRFTVKGFTDKACKAFEYIAVAFASGNKADLKPLLSKELYDKFVSVIDERESRGEKVEFSLIGFDSVSVVKAELYGSIAELTVEFVTDQTSLLKDADGKLLEGDPTYIETVADVWTLRKDVKSPNPVWILTSTKQKSA